MNTLSIFTKTPSKKLTDNDLVQAFIATQQDAFYAELYDRYADKVYRKCYFILKNEAEAADATQDIFTKVFINISQFREGQKFSSWIMSISKNYCIDLIRKNKRSYQAAEYQLEGLTEMVEEPNYYTDISVLQVLQKALGGISSTDRNILEMKYLQEMSIRDISKMLNKSESAIKMRLKRAKSRAATACA
ncbi:MAG: RNA polymerase sigma factor [Aureispira sp.]|nr:RNA polymerase sigma factor [Aureispira sp.]